MGNVTTLLCSLRQDVYKRQPKEHPLQHTELHVGLTDFRVCMFVGPTVGAGQKLSLIHILELFEDFASGVFAEVAYEE